jgi:hypothetical protein
MVIADILFSLETKKHQGDVQTTVSMSSKYIRVESSVITL